MRLNKYISEAGVCSRREADKLIEAGRVTVDGKQAVPGMQADENSVVCVDRKRIQPQEKKVVLLFHPGRPVLGMCSASVSAARRNWSSAVAGTCQCL